MDDSKFDMRLFVKTYISSIYGREFLMDVMPLHLLEPRPNSLKHLYIQPVSVFGDPGFNTITKES